MERIRLACHVPWTMQRVCNSETYKDCEDYNKKHEVFYKRLYAMENPVPIGEVDWAKNWLVQHIKNTDFQYKFKLNTYHHEVPRPYVWQQYLEVYYQRLDDEHVILFDAIRDSVEHPQDQERYDYLYKLW